MNVFRAYQDVSTCQTLNWKIVYIKKYQEMKLLWRESGVNRMCESKAHYNILSVAELEPIKVGRQRSPPPQFPCVPLFSHLHFTSPQFLCAFCHSRSSFSRFSSSSSSVVAAVLAQAVSNVAKHIIFFMWSCLCPPFPIFSVSLSHLSLSLLSLSLSLSPYCSLPLSPYSFSSSLPPAPSSVQLEKEREWVSGKERKKEKRKKKVSEWNNGDRRGEFQSLETFSFTETEKRLRGKEICEMKNFLFFTVYPSLYSFYFSPPLFFLSGVVGLLR